MLPPDTTDSRRIWREYEASNYCQHQNHAHPETRPHCPCWSNWVSDRVVSLETELDRVRGEVNFNPQEEMTHLQEELESAQARTRSRIAQETQYRDERDRHFNRLLDMQRQIQSCAADLEAARAGPGHKVVLNKNVTLEEFLNVVRRELLFREERERSGISREEIEVIRSDLHKLWQLAEAAAGVVGIHLNQSELNIQEYIIASVQMIKAMQMEIKQKDVSSDYVMFLQQRNREGARVINEMGEQLRGVWQGNMPGMGVVPGNFTAAVGAVNVAPPIDFKSFKELIWGIYLGLFSSERNLTSIIMDRQMELPIWEPEPIRIDSENITSLNKWEFCAQLVRREVDRFLRRVWQLCLYIREMNVPGSQDYWNGPHDDDHGRAVHVHDAMTAVIGRGLIAQTELQAKRQYIEPATDAAYKTDLEERIDRRYPIYRDLQASINNLTQRIIMFRQVPPSWPEQHERDNTAFSPKKSFDLLALMLSRIEMEYLSIRLIQLLQTTNNYWHLIPRDDPEMARYMSNEMSHAHGVQVACEAELTRPSEIAPPTAYPGKMLPPLPAYQPYGDQIIPKLTYNNTNKGNKDNYNDGKIDKEKKDNESKVRGNINVLEKALESKGIRNFQKMARNKKANFANAPSDASADVRLQLELNKLHEYRKTLEGLYTKQGKGKVADIKGYKK
ncbi:88aac561-fbeb-4f68-abbe-cf06ed84c1b9 [Sclerotinia trifoliorum]|uniref:88aac561-fbeb-4f68-abbe-cf06ed84c1b9 n=1 Tax=Sclerotinia trifoliorum TaxID=28548 RepID=A0A8H2ZRA1_9HELO|nr:88aac561-fbeb-4f68-abbe-cf06ed84c1b9 [Sclerotinia trifoliorum]